MESYIFEKELPHRPYKVKFEGEGYYNNNNRTQKGGNVGYLNVGYL